MARGAEARFQSLPPYRTLPSTPVSVSAAEKLLTAYLDKSDYQPHLHPDAVLNPAGVQLSLSSGPDGGITLHNLRRVQAGLRGENLAPEIIVEEPARKETGPVQPETAAADEVMEDMMEDTLPDTQASEDEAAAIEEDPLRGPLPLEEEPTNGVASDSESEPDDESRYVTTAGKKTSDDAMLDAEIALKAKQAKESKKRKKEEGQEIGSLEKKAKISVDDAEATAPKKEKKKKESKEPKEEKKPKKEKMSKEEKKSKKVKKSKNSEA